MDKNKVEEKIAADNKMNKMIIKFPI